MIKANLSGIYPFVDKSELLGPWCDAAEKAHRLLESGCGEGGEYTGWLRLPAQTSESDLSQLEAEAERIASHSEVLLVIGTGGSYLGSKALLDMLPHKSVGTHGTSVVYAGNGLSSRRVRQLTEYLSDKEFSVNIISKSGGTLEPSIALRIFYDLLECKYGSGADERVTATTDGQKGTVFDMAKARGWRRFVIPADIGGRYSALTAVGLLPCAAAGADIRAIITGARIAADALETKNADNPAWQYAAARRALFGAGRRTELLCLWEPELRWFGEWWKQLFGESEGKCGKGIFPASLEMTADLHSMGQYIQQGPRDIMETMLSVDDGPDVTIPRGKAGSDGLDFLEGQSLCQIADKTLQAVTEAHICGGVPVIGLKSDCMTSAGAGELIYFFELACGISAYMDGVCPFDQPGVDAYKRKMFHLLGKPGC